MRSSIRGSATHERATRPSHPEGVAAYAGGLAASAARSVLMSVAELEAAEIQLEASTGGLWSDAWYQVIRNPGAILGAFFVLMFLVAAIFAPVIAPYGPDRKSVV